MATLKDIAQRVGVSIATVSYCINNTKSVKPETRDKVMQAIRDLNYIPNNSARALKAETTKEIGVVIPDIDDLCHSEILKGIIAGSEDAGYSVNVVFSYGTPKLEQTIINNFIGHNVAGVILITCQPDNKDFFQKSLIRYNIPSVFIERFPESIDANFIGFDNYRSTYYLTHKLIAAGYRKILLMTGYTEFFSEYECVRGFCDAHDNNGIPYTSSQAVEIDLTKEAAFRRTMLTISDDPPQAIIASSEQLTKGIMEAFNVCDIRVPDTTCVVTLGEDCWNETNYLPNVIHTSRTAFTLGRQSIDTLMRNRKSPEFFEKEFMLLKDNIIGTHLQVPPVPAKKHIQTKPSKTIRILAPSLQTLLSLHAVSRQFEKNNDVRFKYDIVSYRKLFETISHEAGNPREEYDIYFFDVSWLTYVATKQCFTDLTDLLSTRDVFRKHIVKKNLENCCYNGRYYGCPIVGGSHILFYRRDLFEDDLVKRQFESMHNSPLVPPRTWTEFNGIARFFTKKFNAYSPTLYGTSILGSINEDLALELLIRLWSFGGELYDQNGQPHLDSPQNIKGFQSILESSQYAEKVFDASIDQGFRAFGTGRTAMLLSFTEYASQINDCVSGDIISKVDYSMLPGRTPANVGWHMGVGKYTKHLDIIKSYFEWLCDKRVSYYMTTLSGQSVVTYPYRNHEIMKLYPWMALTEEGQRSSRDRVYPCQGVDRLIAPYEIETILYNAFKKIYTKEMSIPDALKDGQKELTKLFQ